MSLTLRSLYHTEILVLFLHPMTLLSSWFPGLLASSTEGMSTILCPVSRTAFLWLCEETTNQVSDLSAAFADDDLWQHKDP